MYNTLYEITRNSYLKNIFISGEKIFFIGFIVFVCIVFYLNYSLKKLCKEENIPIQELKENKIIKIYFNCFITYFCNTLYIFNT